MPPPPKPDGTILFDSHRGFQRSAILSVGKTFELGTLHVTSTHSPCMLSVDAGSTAARAVADVCGSSCGVGGGWSRLTIAVAPWRASADIACHLAIVGDSVGLVSSRTARASDAIDDGDDTEDDAGDDVEISDATVERASTSTSPLKLPPPLPVLSSLCSPVSKNRG